MKISPQTPQETRFGPCQWYGNGNVGRLRLKRKESFHYAIQVCTRHFRP